MADGSMITAVNLDGEPGKFYLVLVDPSAGDLTASLEFESIADVRKWCDEMEAAKNAGAKRAC